MQLFHHTEFSDRDALFGLKLQLGHAVSVCIPTLNEAATIGEIVSELRQMCMGRVRLIDEILVIDSGSNDDTCKIASEAGAVVWKSAEISPDAGSHVGKGENLWKALHVARG
ncbi:MAG: glycosyltransferase, partial [Luteolibacter sp.]